MFILCLYTHNWKHFLGNASAGFRITKFVILWNSLKERISVRRYHFHFVIPISNLHSFDSLGFDLGGIQWKIHGRSVNHEDEEAFENYIRLALVCLHDDVHVPKWWIKACGTISIVAAQTRGIERQLPWTRFRRERSEAATTNYVSRNLINGSIERGELKFNVKLDSTPLRKELGHYGVEITKTDFEMTLYDMKHFTSFNRNRDWNSVEPKGLLNFVKKMII